MQDYPKSLRPEAKVGFTVTDVWAAYSPVKNSPADAKAKADTGNPSHSATSGELDIYVANCRTLSKLGAHVAAPVDVVFNGLALQLPPQVVFLPSFALTFSHIKARFRNPAAVSLTARSTLVLDGDIVVEGLQLDGALIVRAGPGARVVLRGLVVRNAGYEWRALTGDAFAAAPEEERVRGFHVQRNEAREIVVTGPGETIISS